MDGGFRGTNADQDIRFSDKDRKLMKQMKFEPCLDQKVDLTKVNIDVLKPWITTKVNNILGMEDDVVINYVFNTFDEPNFNPKRLQINLAGFLNARKAREFMGELWGMMLEAQASEDGIPASLIDKKMKELKAAEGNNSELSMAQATENDWKHRYKSLTGGRYGHEPNYKSEPRDASDDEGPRRRYDERRDDRYERRRRSPEFRERLDRRRPEKEEGRRSPIERERRRSPVERERRRSPAERERRRRSPDDRDSYERRKERRERRRSVERRRRSRSRDEEERPKRRSPRRFTEEKPEKKDKATPVEEETAEEPKKHEEEPEARKRHHKREKDDSESSERKHKKHKKEKKKKHKKERQEESD